MIVNTDAIVLRAVKYGDSKLVVDMFTRQCGRLSFIVSVPRSGRGRIKKQYFQPLTQLSVACDVRPRLQLQRLGDASMAYAYATLTADSGKLAVAMFVAEFLCHALRDEQQEARSSTIWPTACSGSTAPPADMPTSTSCS